MTTLQKAIFSEIKKHINEADYLMEYSKGIKFESMDRYQKEGYEEYVICSGGVSLTRYEVKCRFKALKYEDNIVVFMVNVYSDGEIGIYFDGTEYVA